MCISELLLEHFTTNTQSCNVQVRLEGRDHLVVHGGVEGLEQLVRLLLLLQTLVRCDVREVEHLTFLLVVVQVHAFYNDGPDSFLVLF